MSPEDILYEEMRIFNLSYLCENNKWCSVINEWVVVDVVKCLNCSRDGESPKCFKVGGRQHEPV